MNVTEHVDVVKNEWLAGFQYVVAQVSVENDRLRVDSPDPKTWDPIVSRPLFNPKTNDFVDPAKAPEEFVRLLPHGIRGTYLFATEPHEQQACPYQTGPMVPIQAAV